jgi:hypothetical protein
VWALGTGEPQKKVSFFGKDSRLIHFIHPKEQKYIQKCLKKLHLMSLKLILFQYITPKISKNHFFPSFPRPTFQNVIMHKIFEIL